MQQAGSEHQRVGRFVAVASAPLLLFLSVPLLALILRASPTMVLSSLSDPLARQAITLSLITSSFATLVAILAGLPVAFLLARYRFRGRNMIDTLIDLPMVLPPAVAGLALLMAFGRRGVVGRGLSEIGVELVFTPIAVIMAQVFIAAPFFVKAATAGLAAVRFDLEEAAMLDGASPGQVFRHISLPLTRNILLSGAVMTWARAMGEFGATIIFAGNFPGRTQTMPLAIYLGFEMDIDVALTLSVLLLGVSFGVLFLLKRVLHGQLASVQG